MTTTLTAKSSKADEMATLDRWVAEAGHGTYLASLLSAELVRWVKKAISEDTCPDPMDLVEAIRQSWRQDAESRTRELEAMRAKKDALQHDADELAKLLKDALTERDTFKDMLDRAIDDLHESVNVNEANAQIKQTIEARVAELQQEIVEMKAKCFDLLTAGK